nr:CoA transferase [uncultured Cupriavidus sp.]
MLENLEADFPAHVPRPAGAPTALAGLRVVDFTHFIAGPFATMMLADMGADVIKIEAPGRGDDFRQYPPVHAELGQGAPFLWSNRNKRSIAIDLKTPEGLKVARELVASADVVVENFSTGVMERFGLDYASLKGDHPRLVYCSVSAYGRSGAYSDRLGFDPIAQAESGFVSMNGYADREGVRALSPVMDISTAMMACNAILGALLSREKSGKGQAIEIALFDNAVLMTGYAPMQHLFSGADPQRHGNTSPDTCPSGVFKAKDRAFYINSGNNGIFQRLMTQVIGRPDLAADPDYATGDLRRARREALFGILDQAFAEHPWSHWQGLMRKAGVPSGEVRSVGDAIRSPEARESCIVSRIAHPKVGWVPNIASPIRYSDTPMVDPKPAPAVGQHTLEVLRDVLGYDDSQLDVLRCAGALGKDQRELSGESAS